MSTFRGLPAHILLVHFIVVLAPATAVLAIVCALWPTARRHFTWLVVLLAAATALLTPLTTEAGEWLEQRTQATALLNAHTALGDTMVYFSLGLLVAAALLAFIHLRENRNRPLAPRCTGPSSALSSSPPSPPRPRCTGSAIPGRDPPGRTRSPRRRPRDIAAYFLR